MEISYWHFIDDSDTTVFCDSSFEKLKILAILSYFGVALGLCENIWKSLSAGVVATNADIIPSHDHGQSGGMFPFNCLGQPLSTNPRSTSL